MMMTIMMMTIMITLRQANSVSSICMALKGATSSFMTRIPMSLTTWS